MIKTLFNAVSKVKGAVDIVLSPITLWGLPLLGFWGHFSRLAHEANPDAGFTDTWKGFFSPYASENLPETWEGVQTFVADDLIGGALKVGKQALEFAEPKIDSLVAQFGAATTTAGVGAAALAAFWVGKKAYTGFKSLSAPAPAAA